MGIDSMVALALLAAKFNITVLAFEHGQVINSYQ
jgi:hypothetical protein